MGDDVLHIEDFDEFKEKEFLEQTVRPYFGGIFQDIAMRRHSPKGKEEDGDFIDKVAFFEYSNLPGIINDRFFSVFDKNKNDQIGRDSFIEGMTKVFCSKLDTKMHLTFKM